MTEPWVVVVVDSIFTKSTYLLAFVVSDFAAVERSEAGQVPVRVFARPEAAEQGRYAADITFRIVQAFGTLYGQTFALPKLDLVAVPDFAAGAMENWGLPFFALLSQRPY